MERKTLVEQGGKPIMVELRCECGRSQPMLLEESPISGGPMMCDLEAMGWTFEPDRCPFCNDPTLIDPARVLN